MDVGLEAQLRVLLDKDEIHGVLMRYCRGLDRCDGDMIASCFHPDALDEHGSVKRKGAECAPAFIAGLTTASTSSMHLIGNELIEVDADTAVAESYFVSYLVIERPQGEYLRSRGARYVDRFERRAGTWKIAHRVVVDEWNRIDPVLEPGAGREHMRFGIRSRKDIVYTI